MGLALRKNQAIRMYDTLFERIMVSLVTFVITVTMCILWHQHQEQLLQMLVSDEEYRAHVKEKMDGVWTVLLFCSFAFLYKGYSLSADRRKGSARLQFNNNCNVILAITTGAWLIEVSGALENEGLIALIARAIVALLSLVNLGMLRMMQQRFEFIDLIVFDKFIRVGDVLNYAHNRGHIPIDNGRYKVIDTHLRGIGGVICEDENTGQIVDIPSSTAVRAMVEHPSTE